ncbi:MAG TPA: carbohydrate kinase family protein, partial [Thermoanaerobaculia bacterium]|nr:carbohydrate kinase family protein [Thermoanaerobaculia bacterium]
GRIVVTGSVAFDYLMTFPGKFLDVVVPDRMHRLSVSFLVDDMRRVRGGVAPNIAYNLALLGEKPLVVAAAGKDAGDYREWLAASGVDVSGLVLFDDVFTASFFVSTDQAQNQIATFYAGAMARARELSLRAFDPAGIGLAVVAPNDPAAMDAYAKECRELGIPFLYDPSQQVARLSAEDLLIGLDGASILIGNEYEFGIVEQKTGLSESEILARVPVVIVTRGEEGSTVALRGGTPDVPDGAVTLRIPPARLRGPAVDPTGVGDAFRGGLLAARRKDLPWEVAARAGSVAAAYALETLGPHPAPYTRAGFLARYRENFGAEGIHAGITRLAEP